MTHGTVRKYLWPTVAVFVIAALVVTIVRYRRTLPYNIDHRVSGNPEIVLGLKDVEVVGRSGGDRIWSFKADRADVARGRARTTLLDIQDGKLYDGDKVLASVKAGKAVYDSLSGNVEVMDGVEVTASKRYSVSTDRAIWVSFFKRLTCPGKVRFRAARSELVGTNLVADVNNREVKLDKARMIVDMQDVAEAVEDTPQDDNEEVQR